jgi:hypothetical protein
MTELDPGLFLLVGSLICAVMTVVSLLRHKKRGVSAYIMATAFVVLGGTMLLLKVEAPMPYLITGCILLVLLLGADFAARSAYPPKKDSHR